MPDPIATIKNISELIKRYTTLNCGNYHPESGFKVVSKDGKKEYGLRTTFGDFLHSIQDPRGFMMNRVNPTLVRVPLGHFEP